MYIEDQKKQKKKTVVLLVAMWTKTKPPTVLSEVDFRWHFAQSTI